MRSNTARLVAICFAAFVAMPVITSSCASSDSQDTSPFTGGSGGGKDATNDKGGGGGGFGATGGSVGGGGRGATGGMTGGGGMGATGGTSGGGTGGGGTCNPATCPTPAPPAQKCCVTANGPCGIDYGQGAGCQVPPTGDI